MMSEIRDAKILAAAIKYTEKKIANLKEDLKEELVLPIPTLLEGPRGYVGEKGDKGERGESGDPGKVVVVESHGPIGPKGETGSTGLSIKEATIADGKLHLIREDDQIFTAGDVVGPRGGQGAPGVQGKRGDKGEQGLLGEQGLIGPQGLVGPKGNKGDKGDKGDQGPKGFVGVQGDTGLQGPKGDIGNTGANGADGADGARGAIGPKGDKGDQGPIGPQGSDGIAGPQGPSGRDGTEVDVSAIKKTIEEDLTGFRNQISSQVSRLAMSGGGGSSGGGGEVWLHRLNDVDYNSVKTPSNGQALIYSTSKGKWEAGSAGGGGGGGGSALTIKEEGVSIGTTISEINFIGSTVTASGDSTTITVNSNPDATFIANTVARGLFSTKAESAANTYVNILLSNTNSYIATVDAQRALDLSNTNSYIATRASEANSLLRLSNTNAYIATVDANAAANTYVNILLSNTNAYIATRASEANSLLRLSNTNSYIATVDAQRALDLSNTNSYIASVSGAITVQDEGSALSTAATTLNFVGSGVAATGTGATKTITIAGGSSGIGASGYVSSLLWG